MGPATERSPLKIPEELLEKAQQATGAGITQTVRTGLQLVAASQAYDRLAPNSGQSSVLANLAGVEGRSVIAADTSTWIAFLQGDSGEDHNFSIKRWRTGKC
jgi:hypothetical protein